ncbi:hypothetical protein G7046_g652 [Stylonectria norvegica]|nr:hypothetical protein G7046_g652 [Stylonectria norvegica]
MHLIFDFDGTITQKDTVGELARSALAFQQAQHGKDLKATWGQVVRLYLDDFRRYQLEYQIPEIARIAVDDELEFLSGMKDVEEVSIARIGESGVFRGLDAAALRQAGVDAVESGRVKIRAGFEELLQLAEEKGWSVGVISVNWSVAFISGVLQPHKLRIIANEISEDGDVRGPEFLGRIMTNSSEKRQALRHLVADEKDRVLFFGDSGTDMACLLRGGVVISDDGESTLLKSLKRIGLDVGHVDDGRLGSKVEWARDFREVMNSGVLDG